MGADVSATAFQEIRSVSEIENIDWSSDPFILGGGSNVLFINDLNRPVLHIALQGIDILSETDDYIDVEFAAGENWHDAVLWCVDHGYGGLENLSLIPGTVGAAPIQNIGAYGVELKNTLLHVRGYDKETMSSALMLAEDCEFGYRDSIFKQALKNKFLITQVAFRLTKRNHTLNTSYGAIEKELAPLNGKYSIKEISDAVVRIRKGKLPDPDQLGNCGSFFKNPVVDLSTWESIKSEYPDAPYYDVPSGIKIPAAWLIQETGLKGYRKGDAGIYNNHALILVNHGSATGPELWDLAQYVIERVDEKFGIQLTPEVNVVG